MTRRWLTLVLPALALAATTTLGACASSPRQIRGTRVADTAENRRILETVEQYRVALERRDAAALLALASRSYWEDNGTVTGADDYGYDGLRQIITDRLAKASLVRYSMRYMDVKRSGNRAFVDALVDASYTVTTERGEQRHDMRDQNQFVLEYDGRRWLFVSGM